MCLPDHCAPPPIWQLLAQLGLVPLPLSLCQSMRLATAVETTGSIVGCKHHSQMNQIRWRKYIVRGMKGG